MIMKNPKSAASEILAKFKPAGGDNDDAPSEGAEDPSGMEAGMESAAKEMMSALKADDPKSFSSALMNFINMHDSD